MAGLDFGVLGEASVAIRARFDELNRDFQTARNDIATGLNDLGNNLHDTGMNFSKNISAPIAAALGSMAYLATTTARAGDEIAKTSVEAGLSAQNFQEMSFALGQISQASESEVRQALGYFNRIIGEGVAGNETYIESLSRIGINVEDLGSGLLTTGDALDAAIKGMQEANTSSEAAAVAAELFGSRVGRVLGPAVRRAGDDIDGLREQFRELGLGISDEGLAASEQFVDTMDVVSRQLGALTREIGTELLPVIINDFVPALQEYVIPAMRSVVSYVADAIKWFGDLPEPIQKMVAAFTVAFAAGGPILIALGFFASSLSAIFVLATGPVGLAIAAVALLTAAWMKWGDDIKEMIDRVVQWFEGPFQKITAVVDGVTNSVVGAFNWMADIVVRRSIVPEMIDAIGSEFDRLRPEMVDKAQDAGDAVVDTFEEVGRSIGKAWATTSIENFRKEQDQLNITLGFTEEQLLAIEQAGKRGAEIGRDVGVTFNSAFEDAILQGKSFQDVLRGIEQDLLRLALRRMISEPFINAMAGLGSSFASSLVMPGGFTSTAGVSSAVAGASMGPTRPFQSGGIISGRSTFPISGGLAEAGEAGAEAILPLADIGGKLGVHASGLKAPQVEINIYTPPGTQTEVQQDSQSGRVDIFFDEAIAQQIKPGTATMKALRSQFSGLQPQTIRR